LAVGSCWKCNSAVRFQDRTALKTWPGCLGPLARARRQEPVGLCCSPEGERNETELFSERISWDEHRFKGEKFFTFGINRHLDPVGIGVSEGFDAGE
jgi:hypothetical protein